MEDYTEATREIEQGLILLKTSLSKYMTAQANAAGMADRAKREADKNRRLAEECENRAISFLKKMQAGQMPPAEAERLAAEALEQKQDYDLAFRKAGEEADRLTGEADRFKLKVDETRNTIRSVEGEMLSLKARGRAAKAAQTAAQITAEFDPSPAQNLLRRMTEKIEEDEALAEAYADMIDPKERLDAEIEKALAGDKTEAVTTSLEKMKKDLGLG